MVPPQSSYSADLSFAYTFCFPNLRLLLANEDLTQGDGAKNAGRTTDNFGKHLFYMLAGVESPLGQVCDWPDGVF